MAQRTQPKVNRNKQIVALRLSGLTFAEIGKKFKITRAFAQRVYARDLPKFRDEIVTTIDKEVK